MSTQTQSQPFTERRKAPRKKEGKDYGWPLFLIIVTVLMIAGYFVSRDHLYKAGDNIGYNLGLVGGLLMVTLLIYPLRKRWGVLKNWWLLPNWFKWHMIFGIIGPVIVVFHTTYSLRSINAIVAFACMMLVSGSGIFGRFFYTKIHPGLYGRQSTFEQLHDDLQGSERVKSIFSFAPDLQQRLVAFRDSALDPKKIDKVNPLQLLTLGFRGKMFSRKLIADLEDVMYSDATDKKWNAAQMKVLDKLFEQNRVFIKNYLKSIQEIAHFKTYEYLFSLWHIFHVPLVFMLVFSGIWHVIAVHKY
jgi:hypothetical protein